MIREMREDDIESVCMIVSQHSDEDWVEEVREYLSAELGSDNQIALVDVGSDGEGWAFSVGVVYGEDVPVVEYEMLNPPWGVYPDGRLLLLTLNYVDSEWQGQGLGMLMMTERIRIGIEEYGVGGVFCEAWVKPSKKSSDGLLEKLGFRPVHVSQNYWDEKEGGESLDSV